MQNKMKLNQNAHFNGKIFLKPLIVFFISIRHFYFASIWKIILKIFSRLMLSVTKLCLKFFLFYYTNWSTLVISNVKRNLDL